MFQIVKMCILKDLFLFRIFFFFKNLRFRPSWIYCYAYWKIVIKIRKKWTQSLPLVTIFDWCFCLMQAPLSSLCLTYLLVFLTRLFYRPIDLLVFFTYKKTLQNLSFLHRAPPPPLSGSTTKFFFVYVSSLIVYYVADLR